MQCFYCLTSEHGNAAKFHLRRKYSFAKCVMVEATEQSWQGNEAGIISTV